VADGHGARRVRHEVERRFRCGLEHELDQLGQRFDNFEFCDIGYDLGRHEFGFDGFGLGDGGRSRRHINERRRR
jgi:hypothetical protein